MSVIVPMNGSALLAQISYWEALGTRFSGDHATLQRSDIVGILLMVGVFAAGFWLLHRLGKWQQRTESASPKRLYTELAVAHEMGYRERRLGREIATELGLKDPAELFVRPELFDKVASRDARLARRVFGEF